MVYVENKEYPVATLYTPFGEIQYGDTPGKNGFLILFPQETGGLTLPDGRTFITEPGYTARWLWGSGFGIVYSGHPIREVFENGKTSSFLKFENPDLTTISNLILEFIVNQLIPVNPELIKKLVEWNEERDQLQKEYVIFRATYKAITTKTNKINKEIAAHATHGKGSKKNFTSIGVKTPDFSFRNSYSSQR